MSGAPTTGPGRLAVVLFNLGGPDSPRAVEPFLFNLFNDPAILGVPAVLRPWLARRIARKRAKVALGIYEHLGGRSPLLPETEAQAHALQGKLIERGLDARVFVCMRYWHPLSHAVAGHVKAWAPDRVLLLPLYPQFSSTTTGSSLADWRRAAAAVGLVAPTRAVCCYPTQAGWIEALSRLIAARLDSVPPGRRARVLFSAHGLPKRVIARGDPYQWQVEMTVKMLISRWSEPAFEHAICYQSRVGPLKWIGPSLDEELARAAQDGVGVLVAPVAFVSEHSETLVELDIEYRHKAEALGLPFFERVPTVGTAESFLEGLADLVEDRGRRARPVCPEGGLRFCAFSFGTCPCPAGTPKPDEER